jgi:hypothetical protein
VDTFEDYDPYALYRELRAGPARTDALADLVDPPGLRFRRDPVRWATERAGLTLWSGQRRIMESVRDNRNTAVPTCHEVGKSFTASATACWWIDVHPPGEAFVVTTAPTDKQVEAILWREINRLHSRIGLPGRTNLKEWYLGKELVAFGRKPADHDPSAFQGLHARYLLVIIDEGCGVPKALYDAASSLAANKGSKTLVIGNPDEENGEFDLVCRPGSGWNVIQIGYADTPNFTGEDVPQELRDMLISEEWVDDRRDHWGAGSALFISKCEGRFPRGTSPFIVVPVTWVERCRYLELLPVGDRCAGVDVGGGGDRTVVTIRQGPRLLAQRSFVDPDPLRTTGDIALTLREWGVRRVNVDSIGIGWGVYGALQSSSSQHNVTGLAGDVTHDAEVIPVNFGAGPTEGYEHLYLNKRAEVWWTVGREYSRLGLWDLAELGDDAVQELTTPQYETLDVKGKVKIEPKDDIHKRLGRSPDLADSLLLAFYETSFVATLSRTDMADVSLTSTVSPADWATGQPTWGEVDAPLPGRY